MISIIAAIGKNRELGLNGALIFHIKEDLQFFKEMTINHPVIMGRKTFESIGRPLPNRKNYVITHNPESLPDSVELVSDLVEFLEEHQTDNEEIFVIGGSSVYELALPYAENIYLTEINATSKADTFFPKFNKSNYSRKVIKKGKEDDLTYQFVHYKYNG